MAPHIEKKTTILREPISAAERLSVTLRYLATGESFKSLGLQFRIHWTTVSRFVPEVLKSLYLVLKDDYFKKV